MNLMGRGDAPAAPSAGPSALAGLAGQSHLLNWADKTFGQGLTSLTKGESLRPICLLMVCIAPFDVSQRSAKALLGPVSTRPKLRLLANLLLLSVYC